MAAVVCVGLSTAGAATAPNAAADVEPNDGITQVEGPLGGGVVHRGQLATANDRDWYSFYVTSQTQLDVAVTVPADSCSDVYAQLMDTDGGYVNAMWVDRNETLHFRYTTAVGTNRYLLAFNSCAGGRYEVRVEPAASIVSGPGLTAPTPTGEPNESPAQAIGPLVGGVPYAGSIQTQNDADWFYFFTSGAVAFDLAVTALRGCDATATLYLGESDDDYLTSADADQDSTAHIVRTATGPAKHLVRVTGCDYQFRIDPPTAVAPGLPVPAPAPPPAAPQPAPAARPQPSRRCTAARAGQRRWTRAVTKTRRQLKQVRTRSARRQLKRKLAAQRRTLRRAQDRVTIYCR